MEAAYYLLDGNHPAASTATGDPAFIVALKAARGRALLRAATVHSMEGYTATLREMANSMGDGHIWANPKFAQQTLSWAGIIAAKRGDSWVVAATDRDLVGANVTGATIVSCDGVPAAMLAKKVMPFQAPDGAEATQMMRAGRLLLDDGNPFLTRPKTCDLNQDGLVKSVSLQWQPIEIDQLQQTYWKPAYGEANFGMRPVGKGYWIGIQALEPKAQPVIDAVSAMANSVRAAAYIVVDLRGNGGGDDNYGRKLAEALYGTAYVDAVLGRANSGCESVFRASRENIDAVRSQIAVFRHSGDASAVSEYERALEAMMTTKTAGRELTGATTCSASTEKKEPKAVSLMHAPVIVLTDVACFSSCINMVDYFRKLGAVQVGQITGADTHYSEVREITLPSGLSTFSTLMALMPDAPARIGPFQPVISYDGDIADTAALRTWIPTHALRR